MSENGNQSREWSSRFGYIMVAAGAAIGLGNIWKFPYLAYQGGGGVFLVVYILAKGIPNLRPELFAWEYDAENVSMLPSLINTLLMTALTQTKDPLLIQQYFHTY